MLGNLRSAVVAVMILALPVATASSAVATGGRQAARPAAAADAGLFYTGNAFGTYAFVGSTVVAGKSALVSLGCTTTAGARQRNEISGVNLPGVLTTGLITSLATTSDFGGTQTSRTTSEVHGANVLAGLITADEIRASSATSHNVNGFHTTAHGSVFVNLVVDGQPISAHVPPNTKIQLPGVGRVVLNEHKKTIGTDGASFTVNMIHVYITVDQSGVAKGTQIIVAHATSDLELNKAGSLDGMAFGSKAHVGSTVISGRTALVRMPCEGTQGNVKSNSVGSVNLPGIGSTGTVTDTAQGSVDADTASSETTSTVEGVDLLSGLVTADTIVADAHASKTGGTVSLSDAGSTFVHLVVNGTPIDGEVAPNTKIRVDGLTIWLHRVITSSNNIEVRMIEIIVKRSNPFGLQIGTDVQVAVAEASVH